MKKYIILFLVIAMLVRCGNDSSDSKENKVDSPEELLTSISQIDDSLQAMIDKKMRVDTFKINKLVYHEAINRNKQFFELYPEHDQAEQALENIASMYMQIGVESEAAKWRDSILTHYPNNKNKLGLLEMQMNYYDYDNYNPEKITYYAEQLLALENLPEGKKEDYEFRLKHIDKSFDELIEIRMKEMDSINP